MTRVAVVTGSNKGIGYEVVKGLAKCFDGVVYLTARNVALGEEALKKVVGEVGAEAGGKVRFHQLDISSQDSVDAFKEHLTKEHGGIDVLVNNAAIAFKNDAKEPFSEQAEVSCNVNYHGNKRVSHALLPQLLRAHGRVVMVGSRVGLLSNLPPNSPIKAKLCDPNLTVDDLDAMVAEFVQACKDGNHKEKGYPNSAYGFSKMAQIALSKVMQRKLAAHGKATGREDIIVNACCPGYVDTDMTSHKGTKTPTEGADTLLYLATLPPNVEGPKGQFVAERKLIDWENQPFHF